MSLVLVVALFALCQSASAPMKLLKSSLGMTSWLSPSECGWSGVTCDSSGAVTGISIIDQSIVGKLPEGVFSALPRLERVLVVFSVWNSNFASPLPADLCSGNQIQELGFVNFNISTRFPDSVFSCTQLTTLCISRTQLWGELPDSFSAVPLLRVLELYENSLNGSIPLSLAQLPALEVLELYSNKLSGGLPAFLSNALIVLDVRFNELTGSLDV